MNFNEADIRRGDIWLCDLEGSTGSEQRGLRPVIIMQNDKGNTYSSVTSIIPLTSRHRRFMPTHLKLDVTQDGVKYPSIALVEQIRSIDKSRLKKKLGTVSGEDTLDKIGLLIKQNLVIA